ncbi:MAG: hypothetical protein WBA83_12830 [Burkholderiaceae bacterium]
MSALTEYYKNKQYLGFFHRKGFWGGVAMAAPFYAEFFSWFWVAFMAVPLLFIVISQRIKIKYPPVAIAPMVSLLFLHVVALMYSETKFEHQVIKDVVTSTFLLVIYFLTDEDAIDGFFIAIIPLGVISALAGLIKAALLDRGYLIGAILENCYYYPAGSALCVNYNNLGLLWLVAILGCLKKRWWWFLPILVASGLLSSSRRFIVLVAFLPFVWILVEGKATIVKAAFVTALTTLLVYTVTNPNSFEKFRFGKEPYTIIFSLKSDTPKSTSPISAPDSENGYDTGLIISINRSNPTAMLGTMTDGTLGTASRLSSWKLAFSNLSWLPQGWAHHKLFSCSFSRCSEFHYPHMSIMSEWLIGGVLFGLVAIIFYAWPLGLIIRQKSLVHITLIMGAMPYSLLSGDTVFSLPIYIASMLVALSSVPRKKFSSN